MTHQTSKWNKRKNETSKIKLAVLMMYDQYRAHSINKITTTIIKKNICFHLLQGQRLWERYQGFTYKPRRASAFQLQPRPKINLVLR